MSIYDSVLAYLFDNGIVEGIDHAHATMHELNEDEVYFILEQVSAEKDAPKEKVDPKTKRLSMIKRQVLMKKVQAVRQGGGEDIVASYEPDVEDAVEYFYEEGVSEEELDMIIEEVGDDIVDFIDEERNARQMNVRSKGKLKKDVAKIKADKSDVVPRKTSPKDALNRAAATRAFGKKKLKRPESTVKTATKKAKSAPKKAAPKADPAKKASKEGIRGRLTKAYKKGVERHKAAVSKNEFTKGVGDGVKAVGKAAKDVYSITQVNKKKTVNMQSYESEGEVLIEGTTFKKFAADAASRKKAMEDAVLQKKEQDAAAKQKAALKNEYEPEGDEVNEEDKPTTAQLKAREKYARIKELTNKGKHQEASKLYNAKEEFKALTPDKKDQIRNQAERRKRSADRAQNASDYETSTKQDRQVRKMKSVFNKEEWKPDPVEKRQKKYQEEETSMKDNNLYGNAYAGSKMPNVSSNDKKAIKKRAKNLFKKDLKGEHHGVNEGVAQAAGNAIGYAAKAVTGVIGQGVKGFSNPDIKPKVNFSKNTPVKKNSNSLSSVQADREKERQKILAQRIKDRKDRAKKPAKPEKAAKIGDDTDKKDPTKAPAVKPIVAEFVSNLLMTEAKHKCKNCGKMYTGKQCACGC